jgi:hypothetical protein
MGVLPSRTGRRLPGKGRPSYEQSPSRRTFLPAALAGLDRDVVGPDGVVLAGERVGEGRDSRPSNHAWPASSPSSRSRPAGIRATRRTSGRSRGTTRDLSSVRTARTKSRTGPVTRSAPGSRPSPRFSSSSRRLARGLRRSERIRDAAASDHHSDRGADGTGHDRSATRGLQRHDHRIAVRLRRRGDIRRGELHCEGAPAERQLQHRARPHRDEGGRPVRRGLLDLHHGLFHEAGDGDAHRHLHVQWPDDERSRVIQRAVASPPPLHPSGARFYCGGGGTGGGADGGITVVVLVSVTVFEACA